MNVLHESFSGSITVPIETDLEKQRFVFVEGEINQAMADGFVKQVMHLALTDRDAPIKVLINSGGGEIDAGLKMCDAVSQCPCVTEAYCFGKAYSMAAVLFESVNGKRYMVGHSKLMFHQPSISGTIHKNASEVGELSAQLKEKNELLLKIVSSKSGIPLAKLRKETIKDRYYDAVEAEKAGLSDHTIAFGDMLF